MLFFYQINRNFRKESKYYTSLVFKSTFTSSVPLSVKRKKQPTNFLIFLLFFSKIHVKNFTFFFFPFLQIFTSLSSKWNLIILFKLYFSIFFLSSVYLNVLPSFWNSKRIPFQFSSCFKQLSMSPKFISNFLGKFLFWQFYNRIFFLNRRLLFHLKYSFPHKPVNAKISITIFNKSLKRPDLLKKKNLILSKLPVHIKSSRRFFDFFRNPFSLTCNIENPTFAQLKIKSNFPKLVFFKKLQWPSISKNYKLKGKQQWSPFFKLTFKDHVFINANRFMNASKINWLLSNFLNFNICIFSVKRGNFFITFTTARGFVIFRKSLPQFCDLSNPKAYKDTLFAPFVGQKLSEMCKILNFLGLIYFLKNGLAHSKSLTIFRTMLKEIKLQQHIRGIIIGRALPHSLPGRFKKKRRK